MRVELGARVRTTDGKDVGTIDRLIVDPGNNEIKAAIIRKGMILPRDVEVLLSALEVGPDGSIRLTYTADQVDQLPEFFESKYTATPPAGYVPPADYPISEIYWPIGYGFFATPPLPETDVSTGSVALDREAMEALERLDLENAIIGEGSDVVDRDGEKVGHVARLVFEPDGKHLTSFVVRKGFIFTEDRELPASLVNHVDDGVIYLSVVKQELNL
jgi:sporulation protein YlmC with PRC-barrel domain